MTVKTEDRIKNVGTCFCHNLFFLPFVGHRLDPDCFPSRFNWVFLLFFLPQGLRQEILGYSMLSILLSSADTVKAVSLYCRGGSFPSEQIQFPKTNKNRIHRFT